MQKRVLFIFILLIVAGVAFAQTSKKKKKKDDAEQQMPNSLSPNEPHKDYAPKKKKSSGGPTYESQKDYKKRMEATVKQKNKNERMLETPQYSDPSYFGHKRPPKKHKPNKMKFCKVCGIRH